MLSFAATAGRKTHQKSIPMVDDYYSVQFGLNEYPPVYQFKLWHTERTPHFFLLKETSELAQELKVGRVMMMTYYRSAPKPSMEQHRTRIEAIVNETKGRFQGHYRIQLNILENDAQIPMEAIDTDC